MSKRIEEVIAALKRSGEYERLTTAEADERADAIGRLLGEKELTDEDVELILAASDEPPISEAEARTQAERAVARALAERRQDTNREGAVTKSRRRPDKS